MATDRIRNPKETRTPTAAPRDIRDLQRAQVELGDFAPTFKGGHASGADTQGNLASSGFNLLPNGGFEDGVGLWTDNTAGSGTTLSIETTIITEGLQSLKISANASGTLTMGTDSPLITIPDGVKYLKLQGDIRTNVVSATAFWEGLFYDINGVPVGNAWFSDQTLTTLNTFQTITSFIPVPAGAVSVIVIPVVSGATGGASVAYFDNISVTPATAIEGLIVGGAYLTNGILGAHAKQATPADTVSTSTVAATDIATWLVFPLDAATSGLQMTYQCTADGRLTNGNVGNLGGVYKLVYSLDGGATFKNFTNATANVNYLLVGGASNAEAKSFSITRQIQVSPSEVTAQVVFKLQFTQVGGVIGDVAMRDISMTGFSLPIGRST